MQSEEKKLYYHNWYQTNKEKIRGRKREADRRYKERHKELVRARDREKYAKYYAENPGRYATKVCLRKLRIKQAMPSWANHDKIDSIYRDCPEGYTVDHIVPLRSNLVCGLHVETNLQYLTRAENASKGNRWWPEEMYHG